MVKLVACLYCDDTGIDENGGYTFPCRVCLAGERMRITDIDQKIAWHKAEIVRLRDLRKSVLGNITSTAAALSDGFTKK